MNSAACFSPLSWECRLTHTHVCTITEQLSNQGAQSHKTTDSHWAHQHERSLINTTLKQKEKDAISSCAGAPSGHVRVELVYLKTSRETTASHWLQIHTCDQHQHGVERFFLICRRHLRVQSSHQAHVRSGALVGCWLWFCSSAAAEEAASFLRSNEEKKERFVAVVWLNMLSSWFQDGQDDVFVELWRAAHSIQHSRENL